MNLCKWCGEKAKHQFKNGNWCCSKSSNSCPDKRKRLSESFSGDGNPMYGKTVWKGRKHTEHSKDKLSKIQKAKNIHLTIKQKQHLSNKLKGRSPANKQTIKQIQVKYPIFTKVEEMRYNPDNSDEIQVHCKNHKCKNSKEQGGWFTPTRDQLRDRIYSIELDKYHDVGYYYCSEDCKQECPLFGKTVNQLIKQDQITAGYVKEALYTQEEYQTWRTNVLIRENYLCEYCKEPANIVHHSRPQKLEPGFALDPDFGVACCIKHHYKYGHKTGTECSTGNLAAKIC